ncbi:MAG: diguanylate cyclase [Clostridia bacterium]
MDINKTEETSLSTVHMFLILFLEDKNLKGALSYLTDDIVGLGIGEFDIVNGIDEAQKFMLKTIMDEPDGYKVEFLQMNQSISSNTTVNVFGNIRISRPSNGHRMSCRITATCIVRNGAFRISSIHISIPFKLHHNEKLPVSDTANKNIFETTPDFRDIVLRSGKIQCEIQSLFNNIPGALYLYDFLTNNIKALSFNQSILKMLGYTAYEYKNISEENALALVFKEDLPMLKRNIAKIIDSDTPISCQFRLEKKDNSIAWFHLYGTTVERNETSVRIYAIFIDITTEKEAEEQLKIREEEYRLSVAHSGKMICRYNISNKTLYMSQEAANMLCMQTVMKNVPCSILDNEFIAPESVDDYINFYEAIFRGNENGHMLIARKSIGDCMRYFRADFTIVRNNYGMPVSAVISFEDITQQRKNELAFEMWRQSVDNMPSDKFVLIEHNLTKDTLFYKEGMLFNWDSQGSKVLFDERIRCLLGCLVYPDDISTFKWFMSRERMITAFYENDRFHEFDFRMRGKNNEWRWTHITVQLIEDPSSNDIISCIIFRDVDESKRAELSIMERLEGDALTKLLNRETLIKRVTTLLKNSVTPTKHAIIMIDIDGFKSVNDVYGHAVGDETLVDISANMRTVLRKDDIIGRFGGDEFMICLNDIPYDSVVEKRVLQIMSILRKKIGDLVSIAGSIGIAIYPRDGCTFDELYKNADIALYNAKEKGKDDYAFYRPYMKRPSDISESLNAENKPNEIINETQRLYKKRILLIDDSDSDIELYTAILNNEYTIKSEKDVVQALSMLKRHGNSISVVLLNISSNGFGLLSQIVGDSALRSIPVIMIGDSNDESIALSAINNGAADFITKPLNPRLLRIRIQQVISKSKQEQLRIQSSYRILQAEEFTRYRRVLEGTGTIVFEFDCINNIFTYDSLVSRYIAGTYDERPLFSIFEKDGVAAPQDIKAMQKFISNVALDRLIEIDSMKVRLKTVTGNIHWFRMNVMRMSDEFSINQKLLITFNDLNEENFDI